MKAKFSKSKVIIKLMAAFLLAGCTSPIIDIQDTTSPGAGGNGVISAANQTSTSLTLVWQKGSDDKSPQSELLYKVVESQNPDIDTIVGAQSASIVLLNWTQNIASLDVSGLTLGATYYFNVILKDQSGHTTLYTMLSVTIIEKDPPIPGNSGFLDTIYPKATEQEITWSKATDNIDAQTQLQYKLVRSLSPDIATVADIETLGHGTTIRDWSDMTTFMDINLTKATNYYYNVLVRDTALNIGIYTMALLRTPIPESEVFIFSPGDTLDQHGFTGINLMEPITADGYLLTTTAGLDPPNGYTSTFTTPQFSDMDRTLGNGFIIEWKAKYLASRLTDGFAEENKFWMRVLNKNGVVLYTVLWMPIPYSDTTHFNRGLFLGTSVGLSNNYQEGFIFPSGLDTPLWVSYRMDITSTGITVRDDLSSDRTTTNGSPDWTKIPAVYPAQIVSTDTTYNHIAKIQFQYLHLGDYSILIKDFNISALP
jgi:hypothetical protein